MVISTYLCRVIGFFPYMVVVSRSLQQYPRPWEVPLCRCDFVGCLTDAGTDADSNNHLNHWSLSSSHSCCCLVGWCCWQEIFGKFNDIIILLLSLNRNHLWGRRQVFSDVFSATCHIKLCCKKKFHCPLPPATAKQKPPNPMPMPYRESFKLQHSLQSAINANTPSDHKNHVSTTDCIHISCLGLFSYPKK